MQTAVTGRGVRNTHSGIRSHKRQSGSKAESIWSRFQKDAMKGILPAVSSTGFPGIQGAGWCFSMYVFVFFFFKLTQEGDGMGEGKRYLSEHLPIW